MTVFPPDPHLMQALEFTAEDLAANHAGRLSPRQRELLRQSQRGCAIRFFQASLLMSLMFVAVPLLCVGAGLTFVVLRYGRSFFGTELNWLPLSAVGMPLIFVAGLVLILWWQRRYHQRVDDVVTYDQIARTSGMVTLRRTLVERNDHSGLALQCGEVELKTWNSYWKQRWKQAFEVGQHYTIYYVPLDDRILSAVLGDDRG